MTVSTLSQYQRLMHSSNLLRQRQLDLEQQIGTGLKAPVYSGLGTDAVRSLDIRSKLSEIETYQSNIAQVRTRTGVMDTAMVQISEIARNLQKEMIRLDDSSNSNPEVVTDMARQALRDIGQLLNTQVDGRYLFGGSSSTTPPVNMENDLADRAKGLFDQTVPTTLTAQEVLDGIFAEVFSPGSSYSDPVTNPNGLFNGPLAEGDYKVTTRVDSGFDISYGIKADAEAFRQVIYGIAAIASVEYPADAAGQTRYLEVVRGARQALDTGASKLDQEVGMLGSLRSRMETISKKHESVETLLRGSLINVEDADIAEAVTKLKLIETQMQATYSMIGNQSRFSLVDFLT